MIPRLGGDARQCSTFFKSQSYTKRSLVAFSILAIIIFGISCVNAQTENFPYDNPDLAADYKLHYAIFGF